MFSNSWKCSIISRLNSITNQIFFLFFDLITKKYTNPFIRNVWRQAFRDEAAKDEAAKDEAAKET
jgi:hypothetical protein